MEKRLALFCVLAAFVMGGHLLLQTYIRPPEPTPEQLAAELAAADAKPDAAKPDAAKPDAAKPDDGKAADGKADDAKPAGEAAKDDAAKKGAAGAATKDAAGADKPSTKPGVTEIAPAKDAPGKDAAGDEKPAVAASGNAESPKRAAAPLVRKTLGSLAESSGYRMLVTLSSRGGAVERIEMTSPQYRDLDDRRGYLGHLGLTPAADGSGAVVGVVGAGTPAALATPSTQSDSPGLVVGDVLLSAEGQAIATESALEGVLDGTKPGESLELEVRRGDEKLKFTAQLGRRPLDVIRPERQSDYEPLEGSPGSFLITLDSIGGDGKTTTTPLKQREIPQLPSLEQSTWEIDEERSRDGAVEFVYTIDSRQLRAIGQEGGLAIRKRYQLSAAKEEERDNPAARAYHLEMSVKIESTGVASRQVSYRLGGPSGLPLEGWWYMNKSGTRDVVVMTDGGGRVWSRAPEIHKRATSNPDEPWVPLFADDEPPANRGVRYIGVDANYFAVLLMPQGSGGDPGLFRRALAGHVGDIASVPKSHNRTLNATFDLLSDSTLITAEKPLEHKFTVFAGPKDPDVLLAYTQEAVDGRGYVTISDLNDYGWFGIVSRPLARILHFFYDLVGNYGIAVVMLTLLVRSCMLPISHRATKNAQKMQELSPEIKKIADKYKNEPEKRVKAQQDLFRQHNYNPFGGCLLALCQLPIFIGLYRCLSIDIELRGASLLPGVDWCSNLSGPDMLMYWKPYLPAWLGDETGYLGPFFNVLPLVTIALFLVNQKLLTPPATDEQTRMQQQVMKFMTIFIGVMFFKVASGLCIYFVASSCWSLAEHKLLRKGRLNVAAATTESTPATPPTSSKGREGRSDRGGRSGKKK